MGRDNIKCIKTAEHNVTVSVKPIVDLIGLVPPKPCFGITMTKALRSVFTSRVSGRGYKNGAVRVCVCVCPLALSRLNRLAYGHEIWYSD